MLQISSANVGPVIILLLVLLLFSYLVEGNEVLLPHFEVVHLLVELGLEVLQGLLFLLTVPLGRGCRRLRVLRVQQELLRHLVATLLLVLAWCVLI